MTVESGFSREDVAQVIELLGELAEPVHMPVGSDAGVGGGDVDCLVWRLEPSPIPGGSVSTRGPSVRLCSR
jgi:hypothetical protein